MDKTRAKLIGGLALLFTVALACDLLTGAEYVRLVLGTLGAL